MYMYHHNVALNRITTSCLYMQLDGTPAITEQYCADCAVYTQYHSANQITFQ